MSRAALELKELLDQFRDKSPDDIAAMVKQRGIKGRMGTTYGCPMALLLGGINTGAHVIGKKYIVRQSGETIEKVHTPKNLRDFIRKFDIGGYPELIAPPPRCLKPPAKRIRVDTRKKSPGQVKPRHIKNHLANLANRFGNE